MKGSGALNTPLATPASMVRFLVKHCNTAVLFYFLKGLKNLFPQKNLFLPGIRFTGRQKSTFQIKFMQNQN